jgi:uncharacterized membrane protein
LLLETLAIAASALYLGGALYVALVEQPARLECPDEQALAQWLASVRRTPRWAAWALVGTAAGLTRGGLAVTSTWTWGGAALLAIVPFTVAAMLPIQRRLAESAPAEARALLERWGRLHWLRVALALAALGLFAFRGT